MPELGTSLEDLARSTDAGKAYGVTADGFVPKPLARLVDEKLAAARLLFGDDIDLTSGSSVRKILEIIAVEESRMWEHLGHFATNTHAATAEGVHLSALGAEFGIPRPFQRATGRLTLTLAQDLPGGTPQLVLTRGARLLTDGGHDYFLDERVELTNTSRTATVAIKAFEPGPEMNLDPSVASEVIDTFNEYDGRSDAVRALDASLGSPILEIDHSEPTTGGELVWSDEDYRDLLLSYPKNLWTPEAVQVAVSLVPGVRQVLVKDLYGGLDIHQSIFGNFNFIERLFSEERSLGSPYYFTVLVAPDTGAIWAGQGQLKERVRDAVDQVRPIGIYPNILEATEVGVTVECDLSVEGIPVPAGTPTAVNDSEEAKALKQRILTRIRRYVSSLSIAAPVRWAEIVWAVMEEPGVVDCKHLRLRRYPPRVGDLRLEDDSADLAEPPCEQDVLIGPSEVAVLVEDLDPMRIL